jgi:alkyldihydroxyacetonephosphate synthase
MYEALCGLGFLLAVPVFMMARGAGRDPDQCYDYSDGQRKPHKWGYDDTRFEFDSPRSVRVTGDRYPIAGYSMPDFIPFAEEILGVPITPEEVCEEVEIEEIPPPKANDAFLAEIKAKLKPEQVSVEGLERLEHSHGQLSVDEIYRLLYQGKLARLVDLVLYPESEEDVAVIVAAAQAHGTCLVPYGGGTNVSGALACPVEDSRVFVSVDMRRMRRILWIDEENLQACIEAGISGKELERELAARGYTSGHDPDSIELSTLGGWIATNASGMKKNKYGNIEDIVLEATLVTPTGEIETHHATPRNSTGVPPRVFLFGSEGNFGIITKAILKVHPTPQVRQYGSLVFPSFERGVAFLKQLRQGEGVLPASIRLVNNFEFRFGQALKPAPGFWKGLEKKIQKFFLFTVKGFKPLELAACTLVMEGTANEVEHQKRTVFGTAKRFGAVSGGASNGQRGYMLTFGIAYIRDFFNQFQVMGETFETSVPWDRIVAVTDAVKAALDDQCRIHKVKGNPYLAFRVTQTYHTGVCIYFTMGFSGKGMEKPVDTYHLIEHHLRQVILDNGGSLSHHHGIGKVRQDFMEQVQSPNSIKVLRRTKEAMDPDNVFAIRNGVFNGEDV